MSNENLRFHRVQPGQDAVGEVVEGARIETGGKFWRRSATLITTSESGDGKTELPIGTITTRGLSRRDTAEALAQQLGSAYRTGNGKRGVFELVKNTGKMLEAQGVLYDGKVSLIGSDGVEVDSTNTLLPDRLGLRVARRRLQSDGAGGLSFKKKGK